MEGKVDVAIVDLSSRSSGVRPRREKIHEQVLSFLHSMGGEATKAALRGKFHALAHSDLLRVLDELASEGEVELRWQSPFEYTVRLKSAFESEIPSSPVSED